MQTDVTTNIASFHQAFTAKRENAVEVKMGLKINTAIQDQTAILACEGQIVRGEEINVLYGKVVLQHSPIVVLDLSAITRIDAAGLGILVACFQALRANNQRLVLRDPNWNAQELLHRTNLHLLFEIEHSDQESELYAICADAAS